MRLKLQRKSGAVTQRQPQLKRTIPIDRYYSGISNRSQEDNQSKRDPLRNTDRSKTVRKRQLSAWVVTSARWFGVLGIFLVLLFNLTLNQVGVKAGYTNTSNIGSRYRSDQDYIKRVQAAFDDSLLYRSKLTFSAHDYEQKLLVSLPEVDAAVAVVPLVGTKLQVGLSITEPLAHVTMDNQVAIVGENGKLLDVSDEKILNQLTASTPKLSIEPTAGSQLGSALLTSKEVLLMQLLQNEFDGSSISRPKLDSFQYDIDKRELRVSFAGKSYFAKLTTERDARLQVGALIAALKDLSQGRGADPTSYIDVRVDGRVFVL